MPLMEWSEQLSTGIASVDRQHKVIVGYINELYDGIERGEVKGVLDTILMGLVSYTRTHFAYEEMMFKVYDYAEKKEHLEVHERMVARVADFRDRFKAGETDIGPELLEFLKDWLYHHILEDDMAYTEYLIGKGAK